MNVKNKILHLSIHKKWFDLIASGKKMMEYREDKPYWQKRLLNDDNTPKHFDIVRIKNGYGDVPTIDVRFKGIVFTGPEWCTPANGEILTGDTIVIQLGEIITTGEKEATSYICKKFEGHEDYCSRGNK